MYQKILFHLDFLLDVESCAKSLAGSVIEVQEEALQRLLVQGGEVGERLHYMLYILYNVLCVRSPVTNVTM